MVGTHVNTKTKKINLQGKLRQRTKNRYYHYRLTVSNGIRKEFTLQTRDYDEAVKQASELDSIWLAPTKEVALAQMNALRGFSTPEKDASFDEAWEIYRMHPDRDENPPKCGGAQYPQEAISHLPSSRRPSHH